MTEAAQPTQNLSDAIRPQQTYEDLEAAASGKGGEKLRAINRARAQYSQLLADLKDDPKYAEEYKAETAWAKYQETKEFVEKTAPEAKADFERSARVAERQSLPMPESESVITKDPQKVLLTQNEHSRIRGNLERAGQIGKGTPFSPNTYDTLQQEYDYGMDVGGPRGGAICRAVVDIVRENGGDIHRVVDPYRKDHHRRALADAERDLSSRNLVGRGVSEPPFPRPGATGGVREVGTYRNKAKLFGSSKRTAFAPSKRRPSWK
jgi:hypothetical protein